MKCFPSFVLYRWFLTDDRDMKKRQLPCQLYRLMIVTMFISRPISILLMAMLGCTSSVVQVSNINFFLHFKSDRYELFRPNVIVIRFFHSFFNSMKNISDVGTGREPTERMIFETTKWYLKFLKFIKCKLMVINQIL